MLTCKETARLVSEGLDRKLSLWQRMNLRLHLMMCGACSAYRRQVETLNRIVRRRFDESAVDVPTTDAPACPEQTKRRITESLREQLG
jgi:predicted anti-sigma-YlaC factor YlaD